MSSPRSTDPIDGSDPAELRREMLRLRDAALGDRARTEVLEQRVAELEGELHADELRRRLDRSPVDRVRRLLGRARRTVRADG